MIETLELPDGSGIRPYHSDDLTPLVNDLAEWDAKELLMTMELIHAKTPEDALGLLQSTGEVHTICGPNQRPIACLYVLPSTPTVGQMGIFLTNEFFNHGMRFLKLGYKKLNEYKDTYEVLHTHGVFRGEHQTKFLKFFGFKEFIPYTLDNQQHKHYIKVWAQ